MCSYARASRPGLALSPRSFKQVHGLVEVEANFGERELSPEKARGHNFAKCCHVGSLTGSSPSEYHVITLRLALESLELNL